MTQLNIKQLKKSFGEHEVLTDVSFHVSPSTCVGIVGSNGCGKSTLLHMIAGLEEADGGQIYLSPKAAVAILTQNFLDGAERQGSKESELPLARGYFKQLEIEDKLSTGVAELSGGERIRLALGKILAAKPDLLLLDEPTNSLDFMGIKALIALLKTYPGTILIVSHDRYFLDQTADKIIALEDGRAVEYAGNYTFYRRERERLFNERMHRYKEDKKEQTQITAAINEVNKWSEKAHRDSTKKDQSGLSCGVKEYKRVKAKKMDKKIKNDRKRLEKLKSTGEKMPIAEKTVYFEIKNSGTRGKRILQVSGVSKGFGGQPLFAASDFFVVRGEKVAIFGPNGCGKSTLIHMVQGVEAPSGGEIWLSPSCDPYVLAQDFNDFPKEQTVLQYLKMKLGIVTGEQRTILYNMGLAPRHLAQRITTLSYGEQMKLKLAEPILAHRDFIIFDEPTNHLDLHAREMLEKTLAEYQGTLLLVAHDLYFLEKICDKVLLFEEGKIKRLEYSFAEYLERSDFA